MRQGGRNKRIKGRRGSAGLLLLRRSVILLFDDGDFRCCAGTFVDEEDFGAIGDEPRAKRVLAGLRFLGAAIFH
jgi:hypothetical protein